MDFSDQANASSILVAAPGRPSSLGGASRPVTRPTPLVGHRRHPNHFLELDVKDRVREAADHPFSRTFVIIGRESLRVMPDFLDGQFDHCTKLPAQALALPFIVDNRFASFFLGFCVSYQGFLGYCFLNFGTRS